MNYINDSSVYGVLGKYAELIAPKVWWKNSKHDKIISADKNYKNPDVDVSYFYIDSKPEHKIATSVSHEKQVIQGIFNDEYFKMNGGKFYHLRQYCRKFDNKICIANDCDLEKTIAMIKQWENEHGSKRYRMQMHSSYDKRFFSRSIFEKPDDFIVMYFIDNEDKLIGYSVFDNGEINEDGILEYKCLLRKYIPSFANDICYYIDFASYRKLYDICKKEFVVNMGCSSGSVFKYKTAKFPVYDLKDLWFYTVKKDQYANL